MNVFLEFSPDLWTFIGKDRTVPNLYEFMKLIESTTTLRKVKKDIIERKNIFVLTDCILTSFDIN